MTDYQLTIDGGAERIGEPVNYGLLINDLQLKNGTARTYEHAQKRLKTHRRYNGATCPPLYIVTGGTDIERTIIEYLQPASSTGTQETFDLCHINTITLLRGIYWGIPIDWPEEPNRDPLLLHVEWRNDAMWDHINERLVRIYDNVARLRGA